MLHLVCRRMARVKIAYILTPILFGGAEKVSLNFLREIDRDRFDVLPILLVRPWEDDPFFAREIIRFGYAFKKVPVALDPRGGPLRVPRVACMLYSLLRGGSFDLIHSHGYFADICSSPSSHFLKIKHISTCHGFIATDNKLKLYNLIDKLVLKYCDKVIAVSEGIKNELLKSHIKENRIEVMQNAVSTCFTQDQIICIRAEIRKNLGIRSCEHVIGYLGRLSEEKGLPYLIEAFAVLFHSSLPVKLLLVGDGPEKSAIEEMCRSKGIGKGVIFAGFQTEVEKWLAALDVFVLPSLTEGTPMALLEAMAMQVVVAASNVGGVPKVVNNGLNGLLFPPGQSLPIQNAIEELLKNSNLRNKLAKNGYETVRSKYNVKDWCYKIEQCYTDTLKII